jgi:hypothetical protein
VLKKTAKLVRKTILYGLLSAFIAMAAFAAWLMTGDRTLPFVAKYVSSRINELLPDETTLSINNVQVSFDNFSLMVKFKDVILLTQVKEHINFDDITISYDFISLIPFSGHKLLNVELAKPKFVFSAFRKLSSNKEIDITTINQYLKRHKSTLETFQFSLKNTNFFYEPHPDQSVEVFLNHITIYPFTKDNELNFALHSDLTVENNNVIIDATLDATDPEQVTVFGTINNLSNPALKTLGYDIALLADSTITLDMGFKTYLKSFKRIDYIEFDASNGKGKILSNHHFAHDIELKHLFMQGYCSNNCTEVEIEKLAIDTDDVNLDAKLSIKPQNGENHIIASITFDTVVIDKLANYWPSGIEQATKDWLFTHIKGGHINSAQIDLDLNLSNPDQHHIATKSKVTGTSLSYAEGVPIIENINATLTSVGDNIDFKVDSATTLESKISNLNGKLTNLIKAVSGLELTGTLEGPVQNQIDIALANAEIKNNPLPKSEGEATTLATIKMPITSGAIDHKQLIIDISSSIKNFVAENVYKNYSITNGNLSATFKDNLFNVSGKANLNDALPIDISYQIDAIKKTSKFGFKSKIALNDLAAFGFQVPSFITNEATIELIVDESTPKTITSVNVDLTKSNIAFKPLGINKPVGNAGHAAIVFEHQNDGIIVNSYELDLPGLHSQGDAKLSLEGDIYDLNSPQTTFYNSNFGFNYSELNHVKKINIFGKSFDLSKFSFDFGFDAPSKQRAATKAPDSTLILTSKIEKLYLKNGVTLSNPKFNAHCSGLKCESAEISGTMHGTDYLKIVADPTQILLTSNNAGSAIEALGITNKILNGSIHALGTYQGNKLNFKVDLKEYSLRKAPVVMKVIGLASITTISLAGIQSFFSDEGIKFEKGLCNGSYENAVMEISNCGLYGSSMVIIGKGKVDFTKNFIGINGTLIPANIVNTVVKIIPGLRDIFGKSEQDGFLGLNFTISGNIDDPNVTSNPFSIFTPGEMRNMLQPSFD